MSGVVLEEPTPSPGVDKQVTAVLRVLYAFLHIEYMTLATQIVLCVYGLFRYKTTTSPQRNRRRPYLFLSLVILVLFFVSSAADSIYLASIILGNSSLTSLIPWWAHLGTMCNIIVILLGDGVLIYRCYFIWHYRRWVIIVPSMVLFASFVMAIVAFAANIGTNSLKPSYNALFSTWVVLSVGSNTMSTGLIAGKLIWERRKLSKALEASHLIKYTTATAILIESALPLALAGIVSSIVFAQRANPTLIMVFPGIWVCLSGLCPQLIIFRVAIGNSYQGDLQGNENVSHSIQFASSRPGVSQSTSSPHSTDLA